MATSLGLGTTLLLLAAHSSFAAQPKVFHHSELTVVEKVAPVYPEKARSLELYEASCLAHITIKPEGTPTKAVIEGCPKEFHKATRVAVLQWRWEAIQQLDPSISAQTTLKLKYRFEEPDNPLARPGEKVLHRVMPDLPAALRGKGLGEQNCVADVTVGADGSPLQVTVRDCNELLHEPIITAVSQWLWQPLPQGKTSFHTEVKMQFILL